VKVKIDKSGADPHSLDIDPLGVFRNFYSVRRPQLLDGVAFNKNSPLVDLPQWRDDLSVREQYGLFHV
jgi:hypothetical protein